MIRVGTYGKVLSTEMAPAFIGWMRRTEADVLHLHTPNPLGEMGIAMGGTRAGLVVTHHSDIVRQRGLRLLYGPLVGAAYRRADRIVVSSRRYMESSKTLAPFRDKCVIIPFGLDLTEFQVSEETELRAAAIRRQHGDRLILFVGRLVYYKGLDVLMQALRHVRGRLIVAGDGPMRPRLEELAGEAGLRDRVVFLGSIPHEEKVALYRASDVFVLPATHRSEAFGLVQVEAQACGRPVICTDLDSGVPFVTEHDVSGLVVPPSDPGALAAALNSILDDPALRRRMGDAGRRRAEGLFSLERMLRDTEALYDEVARERRVNGGP